MAFALRASSAIGARPASASRRAAAPRSLGSALPIRSARRTSSPSSPSSSSRAAIAAPPTNAPNHSVDFVSVVFGSKMSSSSVPAEKGDKKALRPLQNGAFLSTSFPRSERGGGQCREKGKKRRGTDRSALLAIGSFSCSFCSLFHRRHHLRPSCCRKSHFEEAESEASEQVARRRITRKKLFGAKNRISDALSRSRSPSSTLARLVRSQRAALPRGFASEPHSVDVDRLFKPLAMTERTEAPATGMTAAAREDEAERASAAGSARLIRSRSP